MWRDSNKLIKYINKFQQTNIMAYRLTGLNKQKLLWLDTTLSVPHQPEAISSAAFLNIFVGKCAACFYDAICFKEDLIEQKWSETASLDFVNCFLNYTIFFIKLQGTENIAFNKITQNEMQRIWNEM